MCLFLQAGDDGAPQAEAGLRRSSRRAKRLFNAAAVENGELDGSEGESSMDECENRRGRSRVSACAPGGDKASSFFACHLFRFRAVMDQNAFWAIDQLVAICVDFQKPENKVAHQHKIRLFTVCRWATTLAVWLFGVSLCRKLSCKLISISDVNAAST